MALSKTSQKILFGIPVAVGVYLIYKQLKKPKAGSVQDVPTPPASNTSTATPASLFPLKKGSKNSAVGTLQGLLNAAGANPVLVIDSNFGSKTEAALVAISGKSQVDNQAELDALRNKVKSTSLLSSNMDWAWQLIAASNKGCDANNAYSVPRFSCEFKNLVVKKSMMLTEIKKNFQGVWKPTGSSVTLSPRNYTLLDYVLVSALNDGSLRIQINKGDLSGMYCTDPSIELSQYLDIN